MGETNPHPGLDTDGLRQRKPGAMSNGAMEERSEVDKTQVEGKKPLGRTPDGQSEHPSRLVATGSIRTDPGPSVCRSGNP